MKHQRRGGGPDRLNHRVTSVISWSHEVGVTVGPESAEAMVAHLDMVLEANRHHNLTRIMNPEAALVGHIVDSVACFPFVERLLVENEQLSVVDLGSGAGYPGVPLAIMLPIRMTLVESVGKKAEFLRETAQRLGVEDRVSVFAGRAEELASGSAGEYGCVTARALASLPSIVELAAPLLCQGGRLLCMKGSPCRDEISAGRSAAKVVGLEQVECHQLTLPMTKHERTVYVYEKVSEPSRRLPRRSGLAQKRPLA